MKKLPGDRQVAFMQQLIAALVQAIVEHEDRVRIEFSATPARLVFTVFVHHDDMGLVIGEGGKTGDAIRRIVWTAAKKTDRRVDIDFV